MTKSKRQIAVESVPAQVCDVVDDLIPLLIPVEEITPAEKNPMDHDQASLEAIAVSLQRFKQRKPIVVNRRNREIEAGNGTFVAATRLLKWTHIAAVFVEDDSESQNGYAIADNRTAQLSNWDILVLGPQLEQLEANERELFEYLQLEQIDRDTESGSPAKEDAVPGAINLRPHEHFDYVLILARNTHDWAVLVEKLGLTPVIRRSKEIGVGRAMSAEKLLELLK